MPEVSAVGPLDGDSADRRLQEASDALLVVAIGRWRNEALAEVFRRHSGPLFGLAHRVVRNRAVAEEVVQDVFLDLWQRPERFDPERGTLRAFLLTQVHGRSVDRVRSEVARQRREERHGSHPEIRPYDLEREVVDLAVAEQVRTALGDLPDTERRALDLAYFGGHTYQEVAVLLDQPEGTVKSRIRSGLRRLKARLIRDGMTDDRAER